MINTLQELSNDKRNMVFIVSGKERASLLETLNDISNLGLIAEHGMFISWPGNYSGGKRVWETLVRDQDSSWRQITITIMEVYKSRTHGSYIEETEMKVLWQYRDADPEFGYLQAKELEDHLSNVLRNYSVDILHGGIEEGGYVEVRPKGVNKGVAAIHILKHIRTFSTWQKIDFGLILGDDHCDEPMLSVMRQIGRRKIDARRAHKGDSPLPPMPASVTQVDVSQCDEFTSSNLEMFTCTVGKKPSAAANYLHDVEEVEDFLESLVKLTARDSKFYSSIDLRGLALTATSPTSTMKVKTPVLDRRVTIPALSAVLRSSSMGNIHHHFSNTVKSSEQKVGFLGGVMEDDSVVEEGEEEDGVFF
jgi:trehalose 6-phosphate synthase/phosphatase